MRYKYCPECGEKLMMKHRGDDRDVPFCSKCDRPWFDSFQSCVIVLTYNEYGEIVLCRQNYLSEKYATLTSGYMTPGETAEETAIREVKEEIGLDLESLTYAGTYWFGMKDMLMHGFIGFTHKKEMTLSEEVDAAEWADPSEAPKRFFPDRPGNAAWGVYREFLKMQKEKNPN